MMIFSQESLIKVACNSDLLLGNQTKRLLTAQNFGGRVTVAMIPGDGVGPELMTGVKKVFTSAGWWF